MDIAFRRHHVLPRILTVCVDTFRNHYGISLVADLCLPWDRAGRRQPAQAIRQDTV